MDPTQRSLQFRPDWQLALTTTVAMRVFFSSAAAVLSFVLHPDPALIRSNALTSNLPVPGGWHYALVGVWERFDTLWYLHIAQHGYDMPMAVIFHPLYPMAIRAVSWIMPPIVAALLISTVATFFFLWGLLRLAAPDLSQDAKLRMVMLLCAWPTSFVLVAGYAESLTVALIVWAVAFGRDSRWAAATSCAVLAGVARPSGVLVTIPLLVMAARIRQLRSAVTLLAPVGWLAYWAGLHYSGRLSVVTAYRVYQGHTLAPPWASVAEIVRLVVFRHDGLLAVKFALLLLMLAFSLRREARLEDKLFALAVILQMLMYTGRPLLAGPRLLLLVYPGFVMLGAYAERHWKRWQFGFYLACFGFLNLMWLRAFLDWSLVF